MSTRTSPNPLVLVFTFVAAMCLSTSDARAVGVLAGPTEAPLEQRVSGAPEAESSDPGSVQDALEAGDLGSALEQARLGREADPSPENWRREAQILEQMGHYEAAAQAYEGEIASLADASDAPARLDAARADLERVRAAARGSVADEPPSRHREQLDERWAPQPKPQARTPRPEPLPPQPADERIVRKWYFWVTIAAIAASAAAVTGIAVKAARDRRRDALDLKRDPGTMPPPLFRF